ncbi:MAG TPA: FGGY family carbohydrate kinase, partial [Mobilitalea sp.]|nr:FGGY family carbohydrate kinase [Mobilitalea sp.]
MQKYYLAVDIGASGGRHVLGWIEEGSFHIQQVYRFDNGMVNRNGHLCWDLTNIFHEIKNGLIKCREIGKIPYSMGIDTWGVDFVLLDTHNQILGDTIAYRDARTGGMDLLVNEIITPEALYDKTGIQKQIFNTIFQLTAIKNKNPEIMDKAQDLLMLPDYFNFLLTGNKYIEYTNATTTQLVDVRTKGWDYGLIDSLGFKKEIFKGLSAPGTSVGGFCDTIKDEIGFSCEVVLPACHDTGSAVLAVPAKEEDFLYISSGTWSLMGIESKQPYITKYNMEHNFTNEGGYEYRYRVLKNIMGLWMVQNVRKELKH